MIQIFGTKKCKDTQKAERFFKERRIEFQFRDLTQKGISGKEFENIKQHYTLDNIIDKEGKQFSKRNLQYMTYDIEQELLEDPLLFRTPIVRSNRDVVIGHEPDVWMRFVQYYE